ncbi:MAG: Sec-independent protein translocase protein TatB [Rhodoferax sp.]
MIDLGISKLALIGAVALVVIGPEKLPKVARTVGHLLGKAQRYVADVKAEVNRSMALDELQKMRQNVESAAREVESSVQTQASDLEKSWQETTDIAASPYEPAPPSAPQYRHPGKKWRIKSGVVPTWYKAHAGIRTKAQSGAARVARFRPPKVR